MAKKYIQLGKTNAENVKAINDNFSELYEAKTSIYDDVEQLQADVLQLQSDMSAAHEDITALQSAQTDSGWINLELNTGWSMNDYTTDKPQYRKIGKLVMFRGLVNATAEAGTTIATLPLGFRPGANSFSRWACPHNQSGFVNIQVGTNGVILDYTKTTSAGRSFIALNGISFLTD